MGDGGGGGGGGSGEVLGWSFVASRWWWLVSVAGWGTERGQWGGCNCEEERGGGGGRVNWKFSTLFFNKLS